MECCSCGKRIDILYDIENKDFHIEEEDGEEYFICTPCKLKWDS